MSVRVQLDQGPDHIYTNLDYVTGKAILTLPTDATISAITIKLEGESKTRLSGPKTPYDQDRKRTELEVHKLLYKVQTVFPAQELRDVGRNSQFTLLRGQYEYPFQFKLPFNTDCVNNTSLIKDLKVGQLSVQFGEEPTHTKSPLPPTLGGYPGEAYIKYFIKATVVRPKFYQENIRYEHDFKFLPIEPPRPPDRQQEAFARRKHQFHHSNATASKKINLVRKASIPVPEEEPLAFQIDARLPNPPIITCHEPLPLRILVERFNQSNTDVYISSIQIELIGHTRVRAHDLDRIESGTWLLVSQANMKVPLEKPAKDANISIIPQYFWDRIRLPNTVTPSFSICNLSRRYELDIRIGLAHDMVDGGRPESVVLPLRLDVEVYSGIAPPPKLLEAVASQRKSKRASEKVKRPSLGKNSLLGQATSGSPSSPNQPQSYASPPRTDSQDSGNNHVLPLPDEDDLPPSYEDAIAEDIAPVDGPRRHYSVPDSPDRPAFNPDSKNTHLSSASGIGRRVSERLFSQNAPRAPDTSSTDTSNRRAVSGASPSNYTSNNTLHEEPESITEQMRTASVTGTSLVPGTVTANDDEGPKPPLPVRKDTPAASQASVDKQ